MLRLEETAVLLARQAGGDLSELRGLPLGRARVWSEVVVETWIRGGPLRFDVMGSLLDPQVVRECPALLRASGLASAWATETGPQSGSLVWFEWDSPGEPDNIHPPICSLCVSDDVVGARAVRRPPRDWRGRTQLIEHALNALHRRSAYHEVLRTSRLLPETGDLLHVGDLTARGSSHLRLVFFMRSIDVLGWLDAIGWRGPAAALEKVLSAASGMHEHIGVQVEVGETVGSYLGLESHQWESPLNSAERTLWRESLRSLGIEPPGALLESVAAGAGAPLRTSEGTLIGKTYLYHKTAFDGSHWVCKAYLGAKPVLSGVAG